MEQKQDHLLNDGVGKLMFKYALPCIISMLVAAFYNIVDQIFIGWGVGSEGNAATTVVFPLTIAALAISVMIADGSCAFVSLSLGRKDAGSAHRSVGNSIVLSLGASVILTAVFFIFSDRILVIFGATEGTLTFDYAKEYFFYITCGIPVYMFGQAMNAIIRSDGSPRYAMIASLTGAVLNIILDPIAIFVFKWGMAGAAIATVIGELVTAVLSLVYICNMKNVRLEKSSFRLSGRIISRIIPLGICSFLSQISLVLNIATTNNMVRVYSATDPVFSIAENAHIPLAVIGIVAKVYQIVLSTAIGMALGCMPIVGYNIGAGRSGRAKGVFTRLLLVEGCVGLAALLAVELFPRQIIGLFGTGSEIYIQFGVRCFRIYLSMLILSCINKSTFIFIQSLGRPWLSTMLSLLREVILCVPLVFIMPMFFGLDGVLYSMPLADIIACGASVAVIISTYKTLSKPRMTA